MKGVIKARCIGGTLFGDNTEAIRESGESVETTSAPGNLLCTKCRLYKPGTQFPPGGRKRAKHSWCRSCHSEHSAANLRSGYQFLAKLKDQPCKDCRNSYPAVVMDFDHVRGNKRFCISEKASYPIRTLQREAMKCDIVCANCHRIRTWNRKHPENPILNPVFSEDIVRTAQRCVETGGNVLSRPLAE